MWWNFVSVRPFGLSTSFCWKSSLAAPMAMARGEGYDVPDDAISVVDGDDEVTSLFDTESAGCEVMCRYLGGSRGSKCSVFSAKFQIFRPDRL